MPAAPGLEEGTLLMSPAGVVKIVKEIKGGYAVTLLHNGESIELPYGKLRSSVTTEGEIWEFGMSNIDRFHAATRLLAQNSGKIRKENWVKDLYSLLIQIINRIQPKLPVPKLHPPEHLEEASDFFGEQAPGAQFDHRDWSISISPASYKMTKEKGLASLSGDLYHELRHAEQYFVGARVMAKDYLTTPEKDRPPLSAEELIDQELGLPGEIIKKAIASAGKWEISKEDLEGELGDGVKLVDKLTTSLERGSQSKLEIVRLREIESDGAGIQKKIRDAEENINKVEKRLPPFNTIDPIHLESTIALFKGHLKGHQEELAELQKKRDAQEGAVNKIQAAYFLDPTENDAKTLGNEFTAEFSRLTGMKGEEAGKGAGKEEEHKGSPPLKRKKKYYAPLPEDAYNKVIAGIRSTLPPTIGQAHVTGTIHPNHPLSQAQIIALGGRTVLPTVPDGDCAINAVIESLGNTTSTPRIIRAEIATIARNSDMINDAAALDMLQPGDWSQSNIALAVMGSKIPVYIRILCSNGTYLTAGPSNAQKKVVIVHIPGPTPHFYGTRA
jgi:hypothetical protein